MRLYIADSVRTNNFSDKQLIQKISKVWKEASGLLADNPNTRYGVYHAYESNYRGDYSLSVASEDEISSRFIDMADHDQYKLFPVDKTDEDGIVKTWETIWALEEKGKLQRSYTYDFERYAPNGDITVYIAVEA